ncbi:MAG: anhydro-N-acetylmuramic acid kinase [Phycisphaerales bacterium]
MDETRSERLVVGTMTGTSIDGIDVALARIHGIGLEMRAELIRYASHSLGPLSFQLRNAAAQQPMTAGDFATLAFEFGRIHADCIDSIIETGDPVDLIAIHGQTVFHDPPISWQLLNPAPIAQQFGCPVVSALRQADLAAGGQGAPITPLADWILFREALHSRVIVNLGGFCNVTILEAGAGVETIRAIQGFDVCACNQVLNAVAMLALDMQYDEDGRAALEGTICEGLCTSLYETLVAQRESERSLGTGDESIDWVRAHLKKTKPNDLAASATMAVAMCIGDELNRSQAAEAIVSGGSAHNVALMTALAKATDVPIRSSAELGVPESIREAFCMTILGALSADGVPITLTQVTGCSEPPPVAGVWSMPFGWE